eukprot:s3333_g10.t1
MAGKVREDAHFRRQKGEDPQEVPRVSLDYCFLGRMLDLGDSVDPKAQDLKEPQGEDESNVPVLVILDERTGCVFASVVAKGANPHAINVVVEALRFTGRQKVLLHTDGEPSIRSLADAAAKQWNKEAQIQVAPRDSHASNGAVERAILEVSRQVRTVVNALEMRYPDFKVKPNSLIYPWAVRHAAWLLTRFLVKTDGKTGYERLRGRDYKGEITEFGEISHFKLADDKKGKLDAQSAIGVWLGKSLNSDEHYLGTESGIRRCRSLWRRPERLRWSRDKLDSMKGVPWQPKGEPTSILRPESRPERGPRSVYITLDRQIKYGQTPGCPGCNSTLEDPKRHSAECKKRFEELLKKDQALQDKKESIADVEMQQESDAIEVPEVDAGRPAPSSGSAGSTAGHAGSPAGQLGPADSPADPTGIKRSTSVTESSTEQKKERKTPKQGEKRSAEVSTDDLADMGAMPSETEEEAYDERTGVQLPLDKVKRARGRELDKMEEHQVKTDITWEEARRRGLKIVRSRWVDGWKPLPDDPSGVRRKIAVMPPEDVYDGHLWYLLKAMNGTREASKQWGEFVEGKVSKAGFLPVKVVPGLFYHPEWQVTLSCHGDDFLAEGLSSDLDKLDESMVASFETKVLPRIGPEQWGGQAQQGSHLHRIIKWTGTGFTWEADPKYVDILVSELGLQGAKGVDTPSSKDTGKGDRTADKELPAEQAAEFRRLHMMRLRRLVRYLAKYPSEVWLYELQDAPSDIVVYTDSDWAADKNTRRSMSAYAEKFGVHLIETSCARQTVVALSSGEAEFYSLTRGGAAGLMSKQIWAGLGYGNLDLILDTDSTAAKGIASRVGVGKLKHLDIKELWLQDHVRSGKLRIRKVDTDVNWADLATKSLSGQRISNLLSIMPLCRRGLTVACLLCCLTGAKAQEEQEGDWWRFMMYMVFVHVLAVVAIAWGIISMCGRWCRRTVVITTRNTSTQTDPPELLAAGPKAEVHGGGPRLRKPEVLTDLSQDRVYVIGNGEKYHKRTCGMVQAAMQRGNQVREVSRSHAILANYTACRQCGG